MTLKLSLLSKEQLEVEAETLFNDSADLKRDMLLLMSELDRALEARRCDRLDEHLRFIMHEDTHDVLLWQAGRVLDRASNLAARIDDLTMEVRL